MDDLSLKELCERCNIVCSKCLDTGKLWKNRDHPFAHLDLRGPYDVIRCDSCSDGGWLYCSHTNQIEEIGIRLFNKDDNNEASRKSVVNDIYYQLLVNEKCVKQQIENERLKKLQQERDEQDRLENERLKKLQQERDEKDRLENECLKKLQREREEQERLEEERLKKLQREREEQERLEEERLKKLQREREEQEQDEQRKREQERKRIEQEQADESYKISLIKRKRERIERAMNDNNPQPIWGESLEESFSSSTQDINIQGELGKLLTKVSDAIQAYGGDLISLANTIKDIKIDIDFHSDDEKIEQTKCSQSTTQDGFPIYLFLTITSSKENTYCKLLEWCGCISSEIKMTIKYMILFPKNISAQKICDESVRNITGSKLDKFVNLLSR